MKPAIWVLIVVVHSWGTEPGTGSAVGFQEFTSLLKCENAQEQITTAFKRPDAVEVFCVPK